MTWLEQLLAASGATTQDFWRALLWHPLFSLSFLALLPLIWTYYGMGIKAGRIAHLFLWVCAWLWLFSLSAGLHILADKAKLGF